MDNKVFSNQLQIILDDLDEVHKAIHEIEEYKALRMLEVPMLKVLDLISILQAKESANE